MPLYCCHVVITNMDGKSWWTVHDDLTLHERYVYLYARLVVESTIFHI